MHPYQSNRFHSVIFPNSSSFHTYLQHFMSIKDISDLKVWGQCFVFNMDTTCFQCSEKPYYLPFIWLGLSCYFMEILHLMCASLWIITSVLELHFQWKLEYFIILKHVTYHAYHHVHHLPLRNIWKERT